MKPLITIQDRTWRRTLLFSLLILIALVFTACHDAKDEWPEPVANTEIAAEQRCINDCSECHQQNCCCVIEMIDSQTEGLELCGNFNGCGMAPDCGPFMAPAPCGMISGVSDVTDPMTPNDSYHFCIAGSEDIYIFNPWNDTVRFRVLCPTVSPDPPPAEIIVELGPQERAFLQIDGDCNVEECD